MYLRNASFERLFSTSFLHPAVEHTIARDLRSGACFPGSAVPVGQFAPDTEYQECVNDEIHKMLTNLTRFDKAVRNLVAQIVTTRIGIERQEVQ